jgi:[acyl-carrier-protein] S-malonyltransferase
MLSIIGLADDIVAEIAAEAGVEVANFNSPGQVVLSGSKAGIAAAEPIAKEKKARMAIPLPVAGAFHSSLMQSAADEFAAFLAEIDFKSPEVPVLSNVTGIPHENIDSIRTRMAEQITGSVQWVKNAQWLLDNGITTMVECGPGKVLSGLVKRIDKTASLHSVNDSGSLEATVDALSTND